MHENKNLLSYENFVKCSICYGTRCISCILVHTCLSDDDYYYYYHYNIIFFSHLLQNAFVLCRLFKKQDETIEAPNCDEAEIIIPSPTPAKSSPEDTESELALPPASPSGRQAENSDGTASDIVASHEYGNYAEDQVTEEAEAEVSK